MSSSVSTTVDGKVRIRVRDTEGVVTDDYTPAAARELADKLRKQADETERANSLQVGKFFRSDAGNVFVSDRVFGEAVLWSLSPTGDRDFPTYASLSYWENLVGTLSPIESIHGGQFGLDSIGRRDSTS